MKEHPILFSTPMILALLADRKFVTRRLDPRWLKVKAGDRLWVRETLNIVDWDDSEARLGACVQYAASINGENNGVRGWTHNEDEKWNVSMDWGKPLRKQVNPDKPVRVIPSIHMPRWASRILLECEEPARRERLQAITEDEAEAEGCQGIDEGLECLCGWVGMEGDRDVVEVRHEDDMDFICPTCGAIAAHWPLDEERRMLFRLRWDSLHTEPGTRWADDPEVCRIGKFRRVTE